MFECRLLEPLPCRLRREEEAESLGGGEDELLWEGSWCEGEARTALLEIVGETRCDVGEAWAGLIEVGDSRGFLLEVGDARAARLEVGEARAPLLEVRGARLRLLLRAFLVSRGGST